MAQKFVYGWTYKSLLFESASILRVCNITVPSPDLGNLKNLLFTYL